MLKELNVGLTAEQTLTIDESLLVPAVSDHFTSFKSMPPVFATAYLVGFVEWACIEALKPYLEEGQQTVGTHVNLSHTAATPVAMTVTACIELIAIEGKLLRFKVICKDNLDVISEGFHERFIVDTPKFMERLNKKVARFTQQ